MPSTGPHSQIAHISSVLVVLLKDCAGHTKPDTSVSKQQNGQVEKNVMDFNSKFDKEPALQTNVCMDGGSIFRKDNLTWGYLHFFQI